MTTMSSDVEPGSALTYLQRMIELARVAPTSDHFAEDEFEQRHRAVMIGYYALAVLIIGVGLGELVAGEETLFHVGWELVLIVTPAIVLRVVDVRHRITQELLAVSGMLLACGMMIHFTSGLIESHFLFFVALPLIALYTDWRPFAVAVVYVALGHAAVGAIDPESMYNHEAAISSPVVWGLIHAGYVLSLCAVMLVHWHFTDRKRLELEIAYHDLQSTQDRLRQAEKLESIGSLAAGVAHEINTPVQFVTDNLQFLSDTANSLTEWNAAWRIARESEQNGLPTVDGFRALVEAYDAGDIEFGLEEMPSAVEQSIEGMGRVAEIVRSMKSFSHPSDVITACDLNELVKSTVTVSRNEWKYVAEVSMELDDGLPWTPVPPGSFNQAVLNMIVNAAHAIAERQETSPGPGEITVGTRVEGAQVQVWIADNGAGIPKEIQARVFDQFFTTKEIGRGTGQGLAIAHSVVSKLGGSLSLDSTVGVGTTFTMNIPLAIDDAISQAA